MWFCEVEPVRRPEPARLVVVVVIENAEDILQAVEHLIELISRHLLGISAQTSAKHEKGGIDPSRMNPRRLVEPLPCAIIAAVNVECLEHGEVLLERLNDI